MAISRDLWCLDLSFGRVSGCDKMFVCFVYPFGEFCVDVTMSAMAAGFMWCIVRINCIGIVNSPGDYFQQSNLRKDIILGNTQNPN